MVVGLIVVMEAWATAGAWVALCLAVVPLWVWRVETEKQLVKRLIASSIQEVAAELGLTALEGTDSKVSEGRAPVGEGSTGSHP
jgi:hypothetical protein